MEDNEKDLLAQLESIMNNAKIDFDKERHNEHIRALVSMSSKVEEDHDKGEGVYLLAMCVNDNAHEMRANGAVTVDGYVPTDEEIERDGLTGIKVTEVHFFDTFEELCRINSDPEAMVMLHEMTNAVGYLIVEPQGRKGLVLLDGMVVADGVNAVWSKDYDDLDPEEIANQYGEFGQALCNTVTCLQMPLMLKQHKPKLYEAIMDEVRERYGKDDNETND